MPTSANLGCGALCESNALASRSSISPRPRQYLQFSLLPPQTQGWLILIHLPSLIWLLPTVSRAMVQKEKAIEISLHGLYLCRQRPTLPHTFACSTIGPAGLNFRVRDGNGWIPRGKITDKSEPSAFSRQLSASCCADLQGPMRGKLVSAHNCRLNSLF